MANVKNYIRIEFNGEETSFDYSVEKAAYLFTALMGIEATVMKETGLDIADIRMLVDEERPNQIVNTKTKTFDPQVVDAEVSEPTSEV